ncbi:MAG: hypothetical protein H0X17_10865 [Deltaproteobacteria bacterium]|nr:hypothetical protein [Deltaproteobacteria bacterium]
MKSVSQWIVATLVASTAIAGAQPLPDVPLDAPSAPPPAGPDPGTSEPAAPVRVEPAPEAPVQVADPDPVAAAPAPVASELPRPRIAMPEVLTTPTGWLLPAAVLYSKTSLDTGGGVTSDTRVGLGDVAELGVATTDALRDRNASTDRASRIQPYITASFRLGVAESRLFPAQPGLTLGFRKSFERNHAGFRTRIAELTLVASKHVGERVAFHLGGAFWDASLLGDLDGDAGTAPSEITMNGFDDVGRQLRPFGGIEVRPLERSQILVDLGWAPELCYTCTTSEAGVHPDAAKIRLKPVLSWGVRYEVARWMRLESGVRVPDIGDANLLDAQIFGQVTFTSWALRRAVDRLK